MQEKTTKENPSIYPELLTIAQTAERSGLSAYAVRKLARSRQGAAFTVRVGQKYLINQAKFAAFLNCEEYAPTCAEVALESTEKCSIQPVPVQL